MPTWWVNYHVVFEIDREEEASSITSLFIDGKQWITRPDEMTIYEPELCGRFGAFSTELTRADHILTW